MSTLSKLHAELLHFGPMAKLGERFVREVCYRLHMKDGSLRAALYEVDDKAVGFVAYTASSVSFHRQGLSRHWLRVGAFLGLSILARPTRLGALVESLRVVAVRRQEREKWTDPLGEVVCLGVRPEFTRSTFARNSGRWISQELVAHAARHLRDCGVERMRMVVLEENKPALFLYHQLGARFEPHATGSKKAVNVWFELDSLVSSSDGTDEGS